MPKILMLSGDDVRALLPMSECIEVVDDALHTLGRGEATQPLRSMLRLDDGRGILGVMPATLDDLAVTGAKIITVIPGNHAAGLESHQGLVLLFETATGRPTAMLDAASITAIRTAAASAIATRALAKPGAERLALLGTGVQAASHLEAMMAVRPIEHMRVWGRDPTKAERFAATHSLGDTTIEAAETVREAVEGADIVCTLTGASEPILESAWVEDGCHINAVGACTPTAREVDGALVARARIYTDRLESAENEAGDLILARADGAIDADHPIHELGACLLGDAPGRARESDVTLFESLGIGIFDLAAGHRVWTRAKVAGRGHEVDL